MYYFPSSISQAKKHKVFLKLVPVKPDNFIWEGHKVVVLESWLDKWPESKDTCLYFKFKIDGKRYKEAALERLKNGGKGLRFRLEPDEADPLYRAGLFKTRELSNYILGGLSGEVIHMVRLKNPSPDQVKLRVYTWIDDPSMHSRDEPRNIVLTFEL